MLTMDEINLYSGVVNRKYSMLRSVYAVVDGLKLLLEKSGDSVIQELFYNGCFHDHYVSNVFVFASSGIVVACVINAPRAMHD